MKDGLEHKGFAEALSGHEGVPVFFVHVVAGEDSLWVLLAEEDGLFGIALYIEAEVFLIEREQEEDAAFGFEHEGIGTEGEAFFDLG